jgi:hypothetical protein
MKTRIKMLQSRKTDKENRTFPNDSFVYMRRNSLPDEILKFANYDYVTNKWTSESLMAHYLDNKYGSWIGVERYYKLHKPKYIKLHKFGIFTDKKDAYFMTSKTFKNKQDISSE